MHIEKTKDRSSTESSVRWGWEQDSLQGDEEEGVAKGCKARTSVTKKEHAGKLCHL